jgi:alkanesulfonate monooxygenase SsuD/methylene tetrahydromethanopterin reductase-like flavin-dependent oxidoreductase (luciferase family)
MDMHPNAGTTGATTGCWTPEEDAQLTSAVTKTKKKKHGKEQTIDWGAVTVLVAGRTKQQCRYRWHSALVSNIDPTTARAGQWKADEDTKLKDGVREHGAKNWEKIAALVPGRTKNQCYCRWHDTLVSKIDPTMALAGKWTADEDRKLN